MKRQRSSESIDTYVTADSEVSGTADDAPTSLSTLHRAVSPPPIHKKPTNSKSATAKVEAGEASVEDHVAFFTSKLRATRLPDLPFQTRVCHEDWIELYNRNLNDQGHHFVIHQHDHPGLFSRWCEVSYMLTSVQLLARTMIFVFNVMQHHRSLLQSCMVCQAILTRVA